MKTTRFFGFWALLLGLSYLNSACKEEPIFNPKPRIYPRVYYPERQFVKLSQNYCPFEFEHPNYMSYKQDTLLVNEPSKHPCWFNLYFPSLNGNLHFTYTPLRQETIKESLYKVYRDAYKLAEEHNRKAVGNEDLIINIPERQIYGVLFNIEGHVASSFQFVLTDSSRHALRGSLYFQSRPNPDSMRPIQEFLKEDIINIINTFNWKT